MGRKSISYHLVVIGTIPRGISRKMSRIHADALNRQAPGDATKRGPLALIRPVEMGGTSEPESEALY